jgi:thioredoxin 1
MAMNRMKAIRLVISAAGLFAAAAVFAAGSKEPAGAKAANPPEGAMLAGPKARGTDMTKPAWKVMFTDIDGAKDLAAAGPTVLFFAASWCPTCQASLRDLEAHGARLGNIKIVIVDYDTSGLLKKTYGVTYQHTWVQIDDKGSALETWSGGGVEEILQRVKKT